MTKEEFAHKWAFPQCNEEKMFNELSELIESHEQEAFEAGRETIFLNNMQMFKYKSFDEYEGETKEI